MTALTPDVEALELINGMLSAALDVAMASDEEIYDGLPANLVARLKEIEGQPGMRQALYQAAQMRKAGKVLRRGRPDASGRLVYFIRAERSGLIKIGSAANPQERLRSLQTGSPEPLSIVGVKPGGERLERALHAKFADFRSHGEWFHPSDELLAEMENA